MDALQTEGLGARNASCIGTGAAFFVWELPLVQVIVHSGGVGFSGAVSDLLSRAKEVTRMVTKQEVAEAVKARFASAAERTRVLARAMKVRLDILAIRRRMRATFAELGEEVYEQMKAGHLGENFGLKSFRVRLDGLKTELGDREGALKKILEGKAKAGRTGEGSSPEVSEG